MDLEIDLRVARGVTPQIGGSYDVIRDQTFSPKSGATDEEVLLRRQHLATEYKASIRAGFGLRFGSAFNSTINSRLD
jgi:hypothetical protein